MKLNEQIEVLPDDSIISVMQQSTGRTVYKGTVKDFAWFGAKKSEVVLLYPSYEFEKYMMIYVA